MLSVKQIKDMCKEMEYTKLQALLGDDKKWLDKLNNIVKKKDIYCLFLTNPVDPK